MLISVGWAQDRGQASPPNPPDATTPNPAAEKSAPPSDMASPTNTAQESSAQEPATDQGGMFVFKKEVEEVILHATVFDEQRRPVPGLEQSAFTVFENGTPQPITSFRHQDVPIAMGIIVDNSGSMREKREEVTRAVLNLIRASNPQDQIFVVNFSQHPYLDQDFTSDVNLLQAALHQVSATGSTALYDAVVASAVHLRNNPHLDKKVLLVITDGQDNMSQETLAEALRQLQQPNGPTLYAIGLTGGGLEGKGRQALQSLAHDTGGVAYFPESINQVSEITQTVAHDIRSQYMIAYRPHNQNGRPSSDSIRVEAHAPGLGKLMVRARSGYAVAGQTPAEHSTTQSSN
ncbi:MAG: VWA domain-containing protein [Terriglobales bacterium]